MSHLEVIEDTSDELRKCGIGDASRQDELHEIIMDHAEALANNQDNLIAYARELAEEWVPDEWRGREGWRIRRVQEKHGVRHLFEKEN